VIQIITKTNQLGNDGRWQVQQVPSSGAVEQRENSVFTLECRSALLGALPPVSKRDRSRRRNGPGWERIGRGPAPWWCGAEMKLQSEELGLAALPPPPGVQDSALALALVRPQVLPLVTRCSHR